MTASMMTATILKVATTVVEHLALYIRIRMLMVTQWPAPQLLGARLHTLRMELMK